ncbi:MAG TPA: M23 family metallopeptidase [Kofleriaceae bacterium]|nr:M23 family metallopeptidase [Kofleriaceae bacterium]
MALHEGQPSVTAEGHVALWHRDCWELRDVPLPPAEPAAPVAPPARWRLADARRPIAAGLVVGAVAGAIAGVTGWLWPVAAADVPAVAVTAREVLAVRGAMPAHDDPPPRSDRTVRPIEDPDEIPLLEGKPLTELYPSLKSWVHPVTASAEYMPSLHSRRFGSERVGIERAECGAGHCGVDLDGPRGRPIVAVAAGIVVHVERREAGADGRSGRYVRIRHEDNTFTAYMHMDDVADGLYGGVGIARGQYLGTLGASGIHASAPHLHFSLEIPHPDHKDTRGEWIPTRYVNPAPFLERSTIVPVIERPARPALN